MRVWRLLLILMVATAFCGFVDGLVWWREVGAALCSWAFWAFARDL